MKLVLRVTTYFALLILAAVSRCSPTEVEPQTLHLLVLAPFPPKGETPSSTEFYTGGPLLIPAVELAVQHVNENHSVLSDYKLDLVTVDSGCVHENIALVSYAGNIFHREDLHFVGIIGPACSAATVTIAPLVARNLSKLLMMSAATSPELAQSRVPGSSDSYNTTFRTIQSALGYIDVFLSLIDENNWERIGVLYDSERFYFYSTFNEFAERINSTERLNFSSGIGHTFFPTDIVKGEEIRVVFVLAGGTLSRQLICLAYNISIVYPRVQWIFSDKRQRYFRAVDFIYEGDDYNCTQDQMNHALNGSIFANYKLERNVFDDTPTVSGLTYREYLEQYYSQIDAELRPDNYSNVYYDAVWSMALALDHSIPWFEEHNISLVDYRYGNVDATDEIIKNVLNLDFEGMTGSIKFNSTTRDVQTTIELYQMRCTYHGSNETCEELYIGNYSGSSLNLVGGAIFINDSFEEVLVSAIPLGLGIVAFVITTFLAITTVLLHLVYIMHRNYQHIKASSPQLMHLIFSGCYLFFIGTLTYVVLNSFAIPQSVSPLVHTILCNTLWWCFSMAFPLIFGTIIARTWRIYRIFSTIRQSHQLMSDFSLVCFVMLLLAVGIVFNLVKDLVDPCILGVRREANFDQIDRFLVRPSCLCNYEMLWYIIFVAINLLLPLGCVILSFLTRHVHRSEFKSTKGVTILVYGLTLVYGINIPLNFVNSNILISFLVNYFTFTLQVLFCQIFLFLPPVLPLLTCKIVRKATLSLKLLE